MPRRSLAKHIFLSALLFAVSPESADSFSRNHHQHCRFSPTTTTNTQLSIYLPKEKFEGNGLSNVQSLVKTEAIPQNHNILSRASTRLGSIFHFDRQKFATLGIAFAVTYNIISNISGSITFSIAWFMASKRVRKSVVDVVVFDLVSFLTYILLVFLHTRADGIVSSGCRSMAVVRGSVWKPLFVCDSFETSSVCFGIDTNQTYRAVHRRNSVSTRMPTCHSNRTTGILGTYGVGGMCCRWNTSGECSVRCARLLVSIQHKCW
jgi:hypothetical protein